MKVCRCTCVWGGGGGEGASYVRVNVSHLYVCVHFFWHVSLHARKQTHLQACVSDSSFVSVLPRVPVVSPDTCRVVLQFCKGVTKVTVVSPDTYKVLLQYCKGVTKCYCGVT